MTQDRPELESLIGYRLKQAETLLRARMDGALRPLGISTPQYACLELLSRTPGVSNSDLARSAFVTRQSMSALLRGLEERGLVRRAERAPTGRALPTELTRAGERILTRAAELVGAIERQLVSGLSEAQCDELHRALSGCIDALTEQGVAGARGAIG